MFKGSERLAAEAAVLEANQAFYTAFTRGDFQAMSQLWAEHAPSACLHPGMNVIAGRGAVLDTWRQILQQVAGVEMACRAPRVHVLGEVALVTCLEANGKHPAHLVATNVFVLEGGRWRMVHHHAGPLSQSVPEAAAGGSN
jgi:ketosteroid isomerase-like protein